MEHFSKFMRPGAIKIGCKISNENLLATAVKNPDGSIAVAVFNPTEQMQSLKIELNHKIKNCSISANALQTILIKP
jgi:glucosylceramidase